MLALLVLLPQKLPCKHRKSPRRRKSKLLPSLNLSRRSRN
jgi:hypothetical protein